MAGIWFACRSAGRMTYQSACHNDSNARNFEWRKGFYTARLPDISHDKTFQLN